MHFMPEAVVILCQTAYAPANDDRQAAHYQVGARMQSMKQDSTYHCIHSQSVKELCGRVLTFVCRRVRYAPYPCDMTPCALYSSEYCPSPDLTMEAFSIPLSRPGCPSWLRAVCGRCLSTSLCTRDGLHALLTQMLDSAQADTTGVSSCVQ